jgi:hypothetical protein
MAAPAHIYTTRFSLRTRRALVVVVAAASGVGGACAEPYSNSDVGDASTRPVVLPAGCKATDEPRDSPNCLTDEAGVFVAPTGKPDAKGTKADPLGSVSDAARVANGKRVFACAGVFSEQVKLAGSVRLYGGFDCASWSGGGAGGVTTIAPPAGVAVDIADGANVQLSDLKITAGAGTSPSINSISIRASNAVGTFLRVQIVADAGAAGAEGATGDQGAPGLDGATVMKGAAASARICTCAAGDQTTGGAGGRPSGNSGAPGLPRDVPESPTGATGRGGIYESTCTTGGTGAVGASVRSAGQVGVAALGIGAVIDKIWVTTASGGGGKGQVAQGGGGGKGEASGGGGGACGGCGGAGGQGGTGGGASIAVLALAADLTFQGCKITTGTSGSGGRGGSGGLGGNGGSGGRPDASDTFSCAGGAGGVGGQGGGGAGGTGGSSIGILYTGAPPTLAATTFAIGTAGEPGAGGQPNGARGLAGSAAETLRAPVKP